MRWISVWMPSLPGQMCQEFRINLSQVPRQKLLSTTIDTWKSYKPVEYVRIATNVSNHKTNRQIGIKAVMPLVVLGHWILFNDKKSVQRTDNSWLVQSSTFCLTSKFCIIKRSFKIDWWDPRNLRIKSWINNRTVKENMVVPCNRWYPG